MAVADEVLTLLVAALPNDVAVYDASVPGSPPDRYVVLYSNNGQRSPGAWDGVSRDQSFFFQVTSVASRPNVNASARPRVSWLADKVQSALTDVELTVPGFVCGPIQHVLSNPPQVDEDVKDRPTVYAVDQFSLLASRT
jgi:hypothetical protein